LYTLFVGALPTVSRAAVMGTIMVLGQQLERRAHAWTTLFAACWAMTLWDTVKIRRIALVPHERTDMGLPTVTYLISSNAPFWGDMQKTPRSLAVHDAR
jgi:hypothetical protein